MGEWEDGHGRHLSNHEETESEGEREGGRGDGGSDLAVASGVADSAADIVAGDLTPGRSISPIPTDGARAAALTTDGEIKPGN